MHLWEFKNLIKDDIKYNGSKAIRCIEMFEEWEKAEKINFIAKTGRARTFDDFLDELVLCDICEEVNYIDEVQITPNTGNIKIICESCKEDL